MFRVPSVRGVELVVREIELRAAQQQAGEQHDGHEQHADDGEAAGAQV